MTSPLVASGESAAPRATAPPQGKMMCWVGEGMMIPAARAQKASSAASGSSLRYSADQ